MHRRRLDRREFVRAVSAGVAAVPVRGADGLARVLGPRKARVVLVRDADRRRGVAAPIKLFDPRGIAGKRVVLKPACFSTGADRPRRRTQAAGRPPGGHRDRHGGRREPGVCRQSAPAAPLNVIPSRTAAARARLAQSRSSSRHRRAAR